MNKEDAIEALKQCFDPELNLDLWTLGLIYGLEVKGDEVNVVMTFTTPFCPYGPMMIDDVKDELTKKGFKKVNVELTFEPKWEPSEELKEMFGF